MRAKRTDANHREILDALEAVGCLVEDTHDLPGFWDALVGHPGTRRFGFLEIKDGSRPPSERKLTEAQIRLWDKWSGFPMAQVTSVDEALAFYTALGSCEDY